MRGMQSIEWSSSNYLTGLRWIWLFLPNRLCRVLEKTSQSFSGYLW